MTRAETIAKIHASLAALNDDELEGLAAHIDWIASDDDEFIRELTDEELALIEQSKEDFRLGRTLTLEECEARTDAFLAALEQGRAAE